MTPPNETAAADVVTEGFHYVCPSCGSTHDLGTPLWRCPGCESHLNLSEGPGIGRDEIERDDRTLWRYRAALPLDEPEISLGEGMTPLAPGTWHGLPVHYKLEFLNPTGSFKDRGISVMLNYLKRRGVERVCNDSSGNGGASLAGYAAAAGMPCRILLPAHTSPPKIIQIAAYGAEVVPIEGTRQDVADAALAEAERSFYASHNWQALFLQGTKTLGYEIWEDLGFRAPDAIVVPLGGGSNLIGCHLAFRELRSRGEIDRLPRLFGVQPAEAAPIHATFEAGSDELVTTEIRPTIAEGIAMGRAVRYREDLVALRETGGRTSAVTEAEIVTALGELARRGIFVEPTSAAAAAGLTRLIEDGHVGEGDTTVLVLTGSGLKATEGIGKALGIGVGRR